MSLSLKELAGRIDAEVAGDGNLEVDSVNTLEDARPGQVSFLANRRYAAQLETTRASAVIVVPGVESGRVALLKTKDPYYAFARAVVLLHGHRRHPHEGIHPKAHVEATATVGERTVIYPGAYVGPRARVGRDCILYPNATVYDDCVLGDRVILQAGAVVGSDGYGYATHKGADGVPVHYKIPQVGNVVIEDDVEVGANCAIARAALGSTVIGRGAKLDNLVALGHGVKVGPHCLLVAHVGIAGSTTLGHHVTLGGQVGVAGHLKVGDNVTVAAQSGIIGDVPDQTTLMGTPAMPAGAARRVYAIFTQLPALADRVRKLEAQVGELATDEGRGGEGVKGVTR